MPINGVTEPSAFQPQYFRSLKDLDNWIPGTASKRYDGVTRFSPRKPTLESLSRGRLLICHDYKGGYTESLFARSYTFNFWSTCEIFIYFSHHRVTIPPPGWITAAHKQGVKMLGTLIFEGGGEEDCLRLLIGRMPSSRTGQVGQTSAVMTLPLSPHYARVLAEIAKERGFDGYLLNFECPLGGGLEQTRSLAAWITVLQSELVSKIGPHAETLWYDSVVVNGQLAWQDRLNSYNLPFFLSSTGLFSNYTWRNNYPAQTAQYFLSLDPSLIGNTAESHSQASPKTLQDIWMGVDVWGRGSHGGGGFGSYKAIEHISPESLGLSVALFGQAWTWETEQDKEGWTWDKWWEYDSKLWTGSIDELIHVPEAPVKRGEPDCTHGPFVPISSFFPRHPPPDPFDICFHTSFCPGTGLSWFVEGVKVYESKNGWTDVDKQTSVGDMLWPRPKLYWDDDRGDEVPTCISKFCLDDAWNGGNSVQVSITLPGSEDELAAYRPLWMPIQSLHITSQKMYEASIIYKMDDYSSQGLGTEVALAFKPLPNLIDEDFVWNVTSTKTTELANGWIQLSVEFSTTSESGTSTSHNHIAAGLVLAVLAEEPTKSIEISLFLGQLNVSPHLPESYNEEDPIVLWADYTPTVTPVIGSAATRFSGTLSWEVATCLPRLTRLSITTPEDPLSAWNCQPTIDWFPKYLYFNIYAQAFSDRFEVGPVGKAIWIGTSGWDGQKNGFDVLLQNLPFTVSVDTKIRFYVRGVNDQGESMKWEKCAFVDV